MDESYKQAWKTFLVETDYQKELNINLPFFDHYLRYLGFDEMQDKLLTGDAQKLNTPENQDLLNYFFVVCFCQKT